MGEVRGNGVFFSTKPQVAAFRHREISEPKNASMRV